MEIRQYDIVLVNLDPTVGSEIIKRRPCAVISPDEMNMFLNTVIIAPMTSHSKAFPSRVKVNHDNKNGWIAIDQIRTIDKTRIIKILDHLIWKEINQVKSVIRETFVD
jgi:mRNA interferase MazF